MEGTSSLLANGKHIVMWDLEDCTKEEAEEALRNVQQLFNLSHIYLVSDAEGSYRAWCFSQVDLMTLIQILASTKHLDYLFLLYTVNRRKATLRTSKKKNRPSQKVVSVLLTYPEPIPERMERVVYDTGLEKQGLSIMFGGGDDAF